MIVAENVRCFPLPLFMAFLSVVSRVSGYVLGCNSKKLTQEALTKNFIKMYINMICAQASICVDFSFAF